MSLDKKKYIPLFHIIKKLKSPDDVSNIMDFLKDEDIDSSYGKSIQIQTKIKT